MVVSVQRRGSRRAADEAFFDESAVIEPVYRSEIEFRFLEFRIPRQSNQGNEEKRTNGEIPLEPYRNPTR